MIRCVPYVCRCLSLPLSNLRSWTVMPGCLLVSRLSGCRYRYRQPTTDTVMHPRASQECSKVGCFDPSRRCHTSQRPTLTRVTSLLLNRVDWRDLKRTKGRLRPSLVCTLAHAPGVGSSSLSRGDAGPKQHIRAPNTSCWILVLYTLWYALLLLRRFACRDAFFQGAQSYSMMKIVRFALAWPSQGRSFQPPCDP
jgi:hypothetical protein